MFKQKCEGVIDQKTNKKKNLKSKGEKKRLKEKHAKFKNLILKAQKYFQNYCYYINFKSK